MPIAEARHNIAYVYYQFEYQQYFLRRIFTFQMTEEKQYVKDVMCNI